MLLVELPAWELQGFSGNPLKPCNMQRPTCRAWTQCRERSSVGKAERSTGLLLVTPLSGGYW